MKYAAFLSGFVMACAVARGQEFLDRLDDHLTFSGWNDKLRARVSGLIDLEAYSFSRPAPGLILSDHDNLLNPRLSLFLDAQLGPKLYLFVQSRIDRGFDPGDNPLDARADEYALRFTPWEDGRVSAQVGKFATVIGTWTTRHLSWDNPFINAPLPYENVTRISDIEPPTSVAEFLDQTRGEKYDFNPVLWGPVYTTGASLAGRVNECEWAAEIKNAPPTSRPDAWDIAEVDFTYPTVSARVGYRPSATWNFGLSASDGAYLLEQAREYLPAGRSRGEYHQTLLGQDISYAWHHLQVWAEFFETNYEVPSVGDARSFAWYLEGKYKFTPRLFGALRWNQQFFDAISTPAGSEVNWARDLWRVDAAIGFRFTAHSQLKLQYSVERAAFERNDPGHLLAAQFTVRF